MKRLEGGKENTHHGGYKVAVLKMALNVTFGGALSSR